MKKVLASIGFLLLVSSFLSSPVFAAVRAGAPCTKAGVTSIASNIKFTCIKSGKKLVWDRGVVIAKPVVKPTPIPTTSSTPMPSPSPVAVDTKWYPWSFRINSYGLLERRGGPVREWSSNPTREGQVIDPVRSKAFQNMIEYGKKTESKSGAVNYSFGSNLDPSVVSTYKAYFEKSIKYFESRIPTNTVLNVLVVSEKDRAFAQSTLVKYLGNTQLADDAYNRFKGYLDKYDVVGKQFSAGGSVSSYGPGQPLLYVGYLCSCSTAEDIYIPNVSHEITHYFQFATTPNVVKQNFTGSYPNWIEGKIYIPNSLMEGSANTLGSSILVSNVGWYSDLMDWNLGRYKQNGKIKSISSTEEALILMLATKSWNLESVGLGDLNYALGQLIWEYYIATYGMESYLDLFNNIQKYGEFDLALQKTESISETDFYKSAAPYVMLAFNAVTA